MRLNNYSHIVIGLVVFLLVVIVMIIGFSRSSNHLMATYYTDSSVNRVDVSDNSQMIAATDETNSIYIWKTSDGSLIKKITTPPTTLVQPINTKDNTIFPSPANIFYQRGNTAIDFNFDGTRILSGGNDGIIRVWDVLTGNNLWSTLAITPIIERASEIFPGGARRQLVTGIIDASYSNNGSLIAVAGAGGSVVILDANSGIILQEMKSKIEPPFKSRKEVNRVLFNKKDTIIASLSSSSNDIIFWDIRTGDTINIINSRYTPKEMIFSINDEEIIVATEQAKIDVWSTSSGEKISENTINTYYIPSAAFNFSKTLIARGGSPLPDGTLWRGLPIIGHPDPTIYIHDLTRLSLVANLSGHQGMVMDLKFSKDDYLLVSGGKDHTVRLWDISSLFLGK